MNEVWKLELNPNITEYKFPKNSQILYAREQRASICVWFLCNPNKVEIETRYILIFGTGHSGIREDLNYIGSGHLNNGALIYHIFDGGIKDES